MGQLLDAAGKRVPVGPYSDVYAFGKLCCYALFRTTEPKSRHWDSSPAHKEMQTVLEKCVDEDLEHRYPGFEPVLKMLTALDPGRQAEEERQQRERARLQQEGETKLARLVREALDRSRGRLTAEDTEAARELCRQYNLKERAEAIAREVRKQWQKDQLREPQPGEILTISLGISLDMKFAWIPPGTFPMGSPSRERVRNDDETQHRVTLTKGSHVCRGGQSQVPGTCSQ
jgi:hypothetical protein